MSKQNNLNHEDSSNENEKKKPRYSVSRKMEYTQKMFREDVHRGWIRSWLRRDPRHWDWGFRFFWEENKHLYNNDGTKKKGDE